MGESILDIFSAVSVTEEFAKQLERSEISRIDLDIDKKSVRAYIEPESLIDKEELFSFVDMAKRVYGLNDMEIHLSYNGRVEFNSEYYNGLLYSLFQKYGAYRAFMSNSYATLEDNIFKLEGVCCGRETLERSGGIKFISTTLKEELGITPEIVVINDCGSDEDYFSRQNELEAEAVKKSNIVRMPSSNSDGGAASKAQNAEIKAGTLVYGSPIKGAAVPISSINENVGECIAEGEIFTCEAKDFVKGGKPTGNSSITFDIEDGNWAMGCKMFGRTEKLAGARSVIKDGNRLRIKGSMEFDEYAKMNVFIVKSIETLEKKKEREDNSEEKRVELHLHTKMSAKDSVVNAEDAVKLAAKFGHRAVAITDHGVAQAYPEVYKALKGVRKDNPDFKVLYGVEGYYINDEENLLDEIPDEPFSESYVVFDIETTGLSKNTEEITEIGAVKIEGGRITEKFAQLINPQKKIPYNITELTGISDDMVKDCPTIDTVLPQFLEFCTGCIVVAHNAAFDTGFISVKAERLGLEFSNKVLDTLEISRALYPNEKKHKLNIIAERLGVSLENHHRAVDDATATAEIFLKFVDMIVKGREEGKYKKIDINDAIKARRPFHIIILAKNQVGLKNMYQLISRSNLEYFHKRPIMPRSVIEKFREGLIIGSACEQGELYKAILEKKDDAALERIARFYDYLEIQPLGNNEFMLRNGMVKNEAELIQNNISIVRLGEKLGIPVAATCDVHFLNPEDEVYRRVLQGAQGYSDADEQAPLYFRNTEEMLAEFDYLGEDKAYEVVIKNPNMIADMIDDVIPLKDGSYPPTIENSEQDLLDMCRKRAKEIYGEELPSVVEERMERELDCILKYGYSVMYIIAHKLVKKSNEAGYLVGSRGSVGSSFAAFLAGITEVNALCPHYICPSCKESIFFEHGEYNIGIDMPDKKCDKCGEVMIKDGFNIPFETFLGFKGDKVPDIDLNFSGEYQATAHKYVGELFGETHVFKAGTIGTIAENTAIGYAKKYYEKKEMIVPISEIRRVARGLAGVKQTTGQHPGGIIVCPKHLDIHDFCPIQHPADKKDSDIITTHFDFHSIHDNLLKLDILGHDDPSTIRMLEDLTGLDATKIPLDDPETMSIFSGTEALGVTPEDINSRVGTFGVPEFGTSFTRQMLVDTSPTTFYELVIIAGLSHGTDVWLNNAQELVKNKIATLSEVIGLRDDIMTYLILKGVEPSLAFKIMEFVRKGRAAKEGLPEEYEAAMRENNVPDWYIGSCKKIKYMFPKAHAAAYVMMAFRVAYFKVHYPIDFYIAYFTVRADLFDAAIMAKGEKKLKDEMRRLEVKTDLSATEKSLYTIMEICYEMYKRGFEFLPVDIYKSDAVKFKKVDGKILPPLNAFQGMGDAAAKNIAKAREDGEFLSQEDMKNRAKINKSAIEVLKENGCLDGMSESSQISLFDGF